MGSAPVIRPQKGTPVHQEVSNDTSFVVVDVTDAEILPRRKLDEEKQQPKICKFCAPVAHLKIIFSPAFACIVFPVPRRLHGNKNLMMINMSYTADVSEEAEIASIKTPCG